MAVLFGHAASRRHASVSVWLKQTRSRGEIRLLESLVFVERADRCAGAVPMRFQAAKANPGSGWCRALATGGPVEGKPR